MEPAHRRPEVRLGVYGTGEEIEALVARARASLAVDVTLVRGPEVDDLHEDLAVQWAVEHPGARPSPEHGFAELRVVPSGDPDSLKDALTRLICPEPEHDGPCAIPWSVG